MSNIDNQFELFRGHINQISPEDQLRIGTLLSECGKDTVLKRLNEIGFYSCFNFYPSERGIYIYYKTLVGKRVICIHGLRRDQYS
jgi:hypothetical protein